VQLVVGRAIMALLLYLIALNTGWVRRQCILAAALAYTGWQKTLISLG
jgi:hypothetical protein